MKLRAHPDLFGDAVDDVFGERMHAIVITDQVLPGARWATEAMPSPPALTSPGLERAKAVFLGLLTDPDPRDARGPKPRAPAVVGLSWAPCGVDGCARLSFNGGRCSRGHWR